MTSLPFDIYPLLRPLIFRLDAEQAHDLAIKCLKKGLVPIYPSAPDDVLHTHLGGIDFPHPLGLAAGFDKQAEVIQDMFDLGFSFVELGGVTPQPQPGNPSPRLFRVAEAQAIINRFGFNSVGADIFLRRMIAYGDTQTRATKQQTVGINLGKNKDTVDAADDYVRGIEIFASSAHFLTLNISSPNTPGLRDMQERGALTDLLQRATAARTASGKKPLLLLKIAPDLDEQQSAAIAEVAVEAGIDGMIVGNTTSSRPGLDGHPTAHEAGGLSGKPLFDLSTKLLGRVYQLTEGKIPLIGCGGVFSGADAYAKIRAGASLIQIYTALIYQGPAVIARINAELAELLKRDGFASVLEAVGADFRKS